MLRSMGALGLCCLLLTGCIPDAQKRLQLAEDAEKDRDLDVRTVGDLCDIGNIGPLQVSGVGLVTGLAGTGHCPAGYYRNEMEQFLLKSRGPANGQMLNDANELKVRQILDNPNNCLVIVNGFVPGGARKGDRFDVDITLPAGSKAVSLAGGKLEYSLLRVYEAAANISSKMEGSNALIKGHILAQAKGPLVVGFGSNIDANELKRGRVWQGGSSRINRPYSLMMRNDEKSSKITNSVAERINFMYQDDPRSKQLHADYSAEEKSILAMGAVTNQLNQRHDPTGMNQAEMAKAVSKEVVSMRVPYAYRFDHQRFMIVSSLTPLRDTDPKMTAYRQRLSKMLLDPRETLRAAMRLEALGRDSIPLLQEGLPSDHPYVRFASAEALTYLGSTVGVNVLTQLAKDHPILVKHCTTALAASGESICRDKLGDLLASNEPALRCAAFHALTLLDETDTRLGGQLINETFWLYRIPQTSAPIVHFATSKRAQVVLFGRNITLTPSTRLIIGDYTVACDEKDGKFLVKRITTRGEETRACSNRLDEVLVALTDLRASYPDLVHFLRKVDEYQYLNCPIANLSIPEVTLEALNVAGIQLKNDR